jgi:hypothetical protein
LTPISFAAGTAAVGAVNASAASAKNGREKTPLGPVPTENKGTGTTQRPGTKQPANNASAMSGELKREDAIPLSPMPPPRKEFKRATVDSDYATCISIKALAVEPLRVLPHYRRNLPPPKCPESEVLPNQAKAANYTGGDRDIGSVKSDTDPVKNGVTPQPPRDSGTSAAVGHLHEPASINKPITETTQRRVKRGAMIRAMKTINALALDSRPSPVVVAGAKRQNSSRGTTDRETRDRDLRCLAAQVKASRQRLGIISAAKTDNIAEVDDMAAAAAVPLVAHK